MAEVQSDSELPVDINGLPVQSLRFGGVVADDIDGTTDNMALPSTVVNGSVIRVAANTDCYIAFGGVSVTATSASHLFVNGVEYMVVPNGAGYIAYLQVSAAGRISVTHMI